MYNYVISTDLIHSALYNNNKNAGYKNKRGLLRINPFPLKAKSLIEKIN
jgi:hypothetical protein